MQEQNPPEAFQNTFAIIFAFCLQFEEKKKYKRQRKQTSNIKSIKIYVSCLIFRMIFNIITTDIWNVNNAKLNLKIKRNNLSTRINST